MLGVSSQNDCLYRITMLYSNKLEEIPMKKKVIAILGIVIVISVCGGIYLHTSRANEKSETIEQETESTQEETLPTEETETMETTETETGEQETETAFQEETTETQETEETVPAETVESTEQTSTSAGQKSTESLPTTAPTASATETTENTVSEPEQTANDGIDHGPEGDKPGMIYIPGYGYITDEGGGIIEGSPEGAENGNKIGVMN